MHGGSSSVVAPALRRAAADGPVPAPDPATADAIRRLVAARDELRTVNAGCAQLERRVTALVALLDERDGARRAVGTARARQPEPAPDHQAPATPVAGPPATPDTSAPDLAPSTPPLVLLPPLDDAALPTEGGAAPVRPREGVRSGRGSRLGVAALASAGTLLIGDAVATVTWQEPISALVAARGQSSLDNQLAELDTRFAQLAPAAPLRESPEARLRGAASTFRNQLRGGDAIGRLRVPRIDDSWAIVHGVAPKQLRKGPGHYPTSSLPGRPGTTAIAGHRTSFGAPFRDIDKLVAGDRIIAEMPYGTFTYRVEGHRIVDPSDVSVLRNIGRPRLVLTACTPLYSAAERWVVYARLISAKPATRTARS